MKPKRPINPHIRNTVGVDPRSLSEMVAEFERMLETEREAARASFSEGCEAMARELTRVAGEGGIALCDTAPSRIRIEGARAIYDCRHGTHDWPVSAVEDEDMAGQIAREHVFLYAIEADERAWHGR